MWAMMPMLRTRSSSSILGTRDDFCVSTTGIALWERVKGRPLPAVVGEGLVGLRHAVDVVLLLEGAALLVGGVEDLADELVDRPLLAPLAGGGHEPAHRERAGTARHDLDRHLVVGPADAPGADL